MTLLRALIDIPEHVRKGDFVLRLSEGVTDPAGTLGEYVVTPELVKCFDQALDFVRDAVARRTSKATYLHGSFGSGKSHFMAVLHLILSGNTQARGIHPTAPVPGVFLAGKLFEDARHLRETMGDEAFFGRLNVARQGGGDGGWGDLEAAWDANRFESAMEADPGSEERTRLVSDLV